MRTPVEVWVKDHKKVIGHADSLVELLAPGDIQAKLLLPDQAKLRAAIAVHLQAFIDMAEGHFRDEEDLLLPTLQEHLDTQAPTIRDALGCLSREHEQMHMFVERIRELLPDLKGEEILKNTQAAEILRISYGVQSLLRHHCSKEEREVFSLVTKLPLKAVAKLMEATGGADGLSLDHLIRPLGEGEEKGYQGADGAEGPEN